MSDPKDETKPATKTFDFATFPVDTLFYERREVYDRRNVLEPIEPEVLDGPPPERRAKKDRRRRIDPTTFEKSYTDDELEFMNAMQRFKVQTGRSFPSHGEVLGVALSLGYRKVVSADDFEDDLGDMGCDCPVPAAGLN